MEEKSEFSWHFAVEHLICGHSFAEVNELLKCPRTQLVRGVDRTCFRGVRATDRHSKCRASYRSIAARILAPEIWFSEVSSDHQSIWNHHVKY